jgi:hypothetical protein
MVTGYRAGTAAGPDSTHPATPPGRELTAAQERAIRAAMQTFVDDDLAFGSGRRLRRWCVGCRAERPAPGFVAYEGAALCNPCATEFELIRARGLADTAVAFLFLRR